MKTLNILTDSELKQIFGPLEDILPLHEGKSFLFSPSTSISLSLCLLTDLLYRLKPKGNASIDAVGQIYLDWVCSRSLRHLVIWSACLPLISFNESVRRTCPTAQIWSMRKNYSMPNDAKRTVGSMIISNVVQIQASVVNLIFGIFSVRSIAEFVPVL